MLRALCECLQIRGAKNSIVFENGHTLKIIFISFIINKKSLIHLPAIVFWWNPVSYPIAYYVHAVRPCFDGARFRRTRYAKASVFPRFLSFPSKERIFKYRWTCQRYSFWYTITCWSSTNVEWPNGTICNGVWHDDQHEILLAWW